MNPALIIEHTKASKALPVISIIASVGGLILIGVSLYSMSLSIKHTKLQMEKFQREEKERLEKLEKISHEH